MKPEMASNSQLHHKNCTSPNLLDNPFKYSVRSASSCIYGKKSNFSTNLIMIIPVCHANFCYTSKPQISADTCTPEGDAVHWICGERQKAWARAMPFF